jgi:hypothetical protein
MFLPCFPAEFCQAFKELIPTLFKLFPQKRKEHYHTHFMNPVLHSFQNQTRIHTHKENYRPTYLMNFIAKVLNKILANQIQQHIKNIIYHNQVGFIPGMEGWFNICKSINVMHI